ncbi:cell wall anchor protein [Neobacillus sp. Marseille-QA0830]
MALNIVKKGAIVAALGVSLSVFSPVALDQAKAASTTEYAQELVTSLKALGVSQVDYLYAYLQSVDLTQQEFNDILKNSDAAAKLLKSATASPDSLTDAQRTNLANLFLDSAQKAHLQVAFVDKSGKAFDLSSLSIDNAKNLVIQIKDLKGNVLATVDPKKSDFTAAAFDAKLDALKDAVKAKKELEKSGSFVPMPSSTLPKTASDLPLGMAVGGLLVVLGGLALVPAMRTVRRMENQA